MLDAHAYVMQVKLCKANTRGVTHFLWPFSIQDNKSVELGRQQINSCLSHFVNSLCKMQSILNLLDNIHTNHSIVLITIQGTK